MGVDIHEYRRVHGLTDPNPAARVAKASFGGGYKERKIATWRKNRAAAWQDRQAAALKAKREEEAWLDDSIGWTPSFRT